LRHCHTSWKVVGSIHFINVNLLAAQWYWGLREMSTKIISWGVRRPTCKADNLTAFNVLKSRSLKLLDPSGFVQDCTGIALFPIIIIK